MRWKMLTYFPVQHVQKPKKNQHFFTLVEDVIQGDFTGTVGQMSLTGTLDQAEQSENILRTTTHPQYP